MSEETSKMSEETSKTSEGTPKPVAASGGSVFSSIPDGPVKFEGAEHRAIGDSVTLYLPTGSVNAKGYVLRRVSDVPLTLGKIIGLAGDFYTNMDIGRFVDTLGPPISWGPDDNERQRRFKVAVSCLLDDRGIYLQAIQQLLDGEQQSLLKFGAGGNDSFARAYEEHYEQIPTDKQFLYATTTSPNWNPINKYVAYYGRIAWSNIDHFGPFAVLAYQAGHAVAIGLGYEAYLLKQAGKTNEATEKLKTAYIHDAFANHYLTDLFSSGHLRAQRCFLHDGGDSGLDTINPLARSVLAATKDWGVWDSATRRMHDEDSATGLLVSDSNGRRWIAYGDKQFFNGHNRINRQRAVEAVSASIIEIWSAYDKGTKTPVSNFQALKMTPMPFMDLTEFPLRLTGNTAPIWWNPDKAEMHYVNKWESTTFTRRQNIKNLSDYSRINAYPGYKTGKPEPHQTVSDLDDSAWVKNNNAQYPQTHNLEPFSGGFIHIQDFNVPGVAPGTRNDYGHSMIIWGPVSVKIDGKDEKTFSLRNRWDQQYVGNTKKSIPIHWKSHTYGGKTSVVRFSLSPDSNNKVVCSSWPVTLNQEDKSKQIVPIEIMNSTPKMFQGSDFYESDLITNTGGFEDLIFTRFFVLPFLQGSNVSDPNVVSIGIHNTDHKPTYRVTIHGSQNQFVSITPRIDWTASVTRNTDNLLAGFFKTYVASDNTPYLLLVRGVQTSESKFSFNFTTFRTVSGESSMQMKDFDPVVVETRQPKKREWAVLVGDLKSSGYQSVISVGGSHPTMDLDILELNNGNWINRHVEPNAPASTPKFDPANLVAKYMVALMPNEKEANTLALITVNRYQKDNRYWLGFRTYYSVSGNQPLELCVDSAVEDVLTSDCNDADSGYNSIAWFRSSCKTKSGATSKNGIVQVFQWFGVLGVRMFAPASPGDYTKWLLVGQTPMMGQTAIGSGYGIDGLWNGGMMPWGPAEHFADIVSLTTSYGQYQMHWGDTARKQVWGWEVDKRWK